MSLFRDTAEVRSGSIALAVLALLVAVGVFALRTVYQPQYRPCDLAVYYTASQAWLAGEDPYDRAAAPRRWEAAGGQHPIMPDVPTGEILSWMPIILVPPTLLLFAPLAVLPAGVAVSMWYALAGLLLFAQTAALADMMGTRLWRPAGLWLLAGTLVLAPVHECFGYGQPSGPAISLMILAAWAAARRSDVAAGLLLAGAVALKPQMGGVLAVYYALTWRWRLTLVAGGTVAAMGAIAVVSMAVRETPWLTNWLENVRVAEKVGGFNSPFPENPMRGHMLHLQMIFGGLLDSRALVDTAGLAATGLLAGALAYLRSRIRGGDEILWLSAVCILGLLPVYHRFYDAALVVLPLAWAIGNLRRRPLHAWLLVGFAMSFALPTMATARLLAFAGVHAHSAAGLWWDVVLEPWRVWALLSGFAVICHAIVVTGELRPDRGREQDAMERELDSEPEHGLLIGTPAAER